MLFISFKTCFSPAKFPALMASEMLTANKVSLIAKIFYEFFSQKLPFLPIGGLESVLVVEGELNKEGISEFCQSKQDQGKE